MDKDKKEMNTTVLGKETVFSGHMRFSDNLAIEGNFDGSIDGQGKLTIEKNAACRADYIRAHSVLVKGEVTGNITVVDYVELANGAKMTGNITASRLKIADEVDFDGVVKMIREGIKIDADFFSLDSDDIKSQIGR